MKKRETINDIIFVILALISSVSFLFFLVFKMEFYALQCAFFFLSLFIPILIEFIFHIKVLPFMQIIYEIFLLAHYLLGEICNYYVSVAHYDTLLHFLTAIILTILGYSIIHYYLDESYMFIQLLFAFLFGVSLEFFWEILEFSIDHFMFTNMQRYIKNGIVLIGHDALKDTIKDMIVASIGGLSIIFLSKIRIIKNIKIKIK